MIENIDEMWNDLKIDPDTQEFLEHYRQSKSHINYKQIDQNIRDLIKVFNRIPWLETEGCCEGHFNEQGNNKGKGYIQFDALDDELVESVLVPLLENAKLPWDTMEVELKKRWGFDFGKRKRKAIFGWFLCWRCQTEKDRERLFKLLTDVVTRYVETRI